MSKSPSEQAKKDKDHQAFITLLVIIVVGVLAIIGYSLRPDSQANLCRILSIGFLVACAALSFGGFFGFLFGMPRALARTPPADSQTPPGDKKGDRGANKSTTEPNTNLEQISDWLTKILVGAGLTQLNKIPGKLGDLSDYVAKGMSNSPSDRAFVAIAVIFFGICGFLAVFLWTRLYMAELLEPWQLQALRDTDQKQQAEIEQAREIVKQLAQTGAEQAMEDPLLSEQGRLKAEKAQIAMAANFVQNQQESSRTAKDFMILAYQNFQNEDYQSAAANAEKALAANPARDLLWKIYNLLGLCYHWQQPKGWKPGDDTRWCVEAVKSYESAVANKNSLAEELLSKANMAFVYLDAGRYDDCERTAAEVVANKKLEAPQVGSIADLARIAAAAAKIMRGDVADAVVTLNETCNIASFEYLFNTDDLPARAIAGFAALNGLRSDVDAFLKRVAQSATAKG